MGYHPKTYKAGIDPERAASQFFGGCQARHISGILPKEVRSPTMQHGGRAMTVGQRAGIGGVAEKDG